MHFDRRVLSNLKKLAKFKWAIWTLCLLVTFLTINNDLLLGTAVGIWDADGQFVAYQTMVADSARAGGFAIWDVWSNGGVPISGDPQVGAYSPLNVFAGLLMGGGSSSFRFYWLFVWWLGGFGIMMLGRHLEAPAWGAFAVALQFLFCGIYTTNAEHTSWLVGFSFLPFIIWRLDVALRSRRLMAAIQAGALWGFSALSAHPGFTIITLLFCGLWAFGRFISTKDYPQQNSPILQDSIRPSLLLTFVALTSFFLVGILVLSPTYFDFLYEGAGTHMRVGALSRDEITQVNALHPGVLSTFASPYLPILKLHNSSYLWSYTDISMCSIYAGAVTTVLAIFALAYNNKNSWCRWLAVFALLALMCALSQSLPLRGWLYDGVYPTRFFRHSAIFRAYYLFFVTVIALIATHNIADITQHATTRLWSTLRTSSYSTAFCAVLVFIVLINSVQNSGNKLFLGYLHIFCIWFGMCSVLYVTSKMFNKSQYRIVFSLIIVLAVADAVFTSELSESTILSKDPAMVERWKNLDREHSSSTDLTAEGLRRDKKTCYSEPSSCAISAVGMNNDQLINKIPNFNVYNTQWNTFHLEMTKNPVLEKMAVGTERIWFSDNALEINPSPSAFAAFTKKVVVSGTVPIIIHTPQQMLDDDNNRKVTEKQASEIQEIEKLPAAKSIAVNVTKYTPEELFFDVYCATDGWLLVTDRWARSWRAENNDAPTEVYGGNFIFRAIKVSAGQNRIKLKYAPLSYPWLLGLGWGTLLLVAVISFFNFNRPRNFLNALNRKNRTQLLAK